MFAPTLDRRQRAEPILGRVEANLSPVYSQGKDDLGQKDPGHKLKYNFVSQRILQVNQDLKKKKTPRTLLELGDLYLLRQHYKKAVRLYQEALELDPSLLQVYQKIITAYISHADLAGAEEYFSILLKTHSDDEGFLLNYATFKAFIDISPENTEEALELFDKIIKKNPKNFEAINSYGMVVLNFQNKPEEAKEYFERANKINPEYIHALNNLGVCYLRQGNYDDAEKILKKVIKIGPTSYQLGYQNLVALYIQNEKYIPALKLLKDAQKGGVKLDRVLEHKIGWLLLMLNRFEEAIVWYAEKIKSEPKNDLLYNNLGVCFKAVNEYVNAEKSFRKAVELFRARSKTSKFILLDHLKCLYNLGRVAVDKRDRELLEQIYKEILAIHPGDAYGIYLEASAFTIDLNYKEARVLYEKVLEKEKNIAEVYPDYSFILSSIDKDLPKAIQILEDAIRLGHKTINIENNLAFAYTQHGNLREAEKIINRYKEAELPDMLVPTKGLLEFRKGNFELGNRYYDLAYENAEGSKLKKLIKQIQLYENARFLGKHNKKEEAAALIREGLRLPPSYATNDLEQLRKEIL